MPNSCTCILYLPVQTGNFRHSILDCNIKTAHPMFSQNSEVACSRLRTQLLGNLILYTKELHIWMKIYSSLLYTHICHWAILSGPPTINTSKALTHQNEGKTYQFQLSKTGEVLRIQTFTATKTRQTSQSQHYTQQARNGEAVPKQNQKFIVAKPG